MRFTLTLIDTARTNLDWLPEWSKGDDTYVGRKHGAAGTRRRLAAP